MAPPAILNRGIDCGTLPVTVRLAGPNGNHTVYELHGYSKDCNDPHLGDILVTSYADKIAAQCNLKITDNNTLATPDWNTLAPPWQNSTKRPNVREINDLSVTAPQGQNSSIDLNCMTGVVAGMQHHNHNHNLAIIAGSIGGAGGLYLIPPALFALCGKTEAAGHWLLAPFYLLVGIAEGLSGPC